MVVVSREIDETLDFTATSEQTRSVKLPKEDWKAMILHIRYKVVDSGIASGEDIHGAISKLLIQTPGFIDEEPLDVRRNELQDVIELMNDAPYPGSILYHDAQPTTNQNQDAFYYIPFAYNGSKMQDNAVLNLTLNAAAEWGGASAFEATVRIGLVSGTKGTSYVVKRYSRSATTGDDVPAPTLPYSSVLVKTATAGDLSLLSVPAGPSFRNPQIANHNWTMWTDQASTENSAYYYLLTNPVMRTSTLRIEGATSEARTVWYVSKVMSA